MFNFSLCRIRLVFLKKFYPLLALFLLLQVSAGWSESSVPVESTRGRSTLDTILIEGERYIPLAQLSERTGLDIGWDPMTRRLVLIYDGEQRVVCRVDTPVIRMGGQLIYVQAPPRFSAGGLYLPLAVLKEVMAPALGLRFPAVPTPTPTPTAAPPSPTPAPQFPDAPPKFAVPTLPMSLALPQDVYATPPISTMPIPEQTPGPRGKVIVIDPGHGGPDSGSIGPEGSREADLVFEIAQAVKDRLEQVYQLESILTRKANPEYEVSAEERAMRANSAGGILFISIHAGAGFDSSRQGFSVFYMSDIADDLEPGNYNESGQPVGRWDDAAIAYDWEKAYLPYVMQSAAFSETLHEAFKRSLQTDDRGLRAGRMAVLRSLQMPAAWVELAQIGNPLEERRLRHPAFQKQVVDILSGAIRQYIRLREHNQVMQEEEEPQWP
mgnify:CR=1 FL=1